MNAPDCIGLAVQENNGLGFVERGADRTVMDRRGTQGKVTAGMEKKKVKISIQIEKQVYDGLKKYGIPINKICAESLKNFLIWSIKNGVKWK